MEYNEKNHKNKHIILIINKKYRQQLHLLIFKTKNNHFNNNRLFDNILHKQKQWKILQNYIIVLVYIFTIINGTYSQRFIIDIKEKEENNK